jgi:carbamoyltransferase
MIVLGINSYTHDVGAALCIDGKIKYAVEEERLSRQKHHIGIEANGTPPRLAVEYVLEEAGISLNEVDRIVHVGWKGTDYLKLDLAGRVLREYAKEIDPSEKRTSFVHHHLCHAASGYYASGFDEGLVASIDGVGDWVSTSLWIGKDGKLEKVDQYPIEDSLGFMYSHASRILGLGKFGYGEGKMTALAGHENRIVSFPPLVEVNNGRYKIVGDWELLFEKYKKDADKPYSQEQIDFATTVQLILEETIIEILTKTNNQYGQSNLIMSGGVALNCRMNGRLSKLPWVENMFIQPAASDSGVCLGAAYIGALDLGDTPQRMDTIYLGPNIDNNKVSEFVRRNQLNHSYLENPAQFGAKLLNNGHILAWVQGRTEFGPRALGHRSLLGDPRSVNIRDKMNMIKEREPWRPVAPSCISSEKIYFDVSQATEHMTKAIKMNSRALSEIPGAIHVDGSARVQLVKDKEDSYYQLIEEFEKITGVPAVLNTSLNDKREPICTTIDDAIRFFYTTPTDDLIIGNWWIRK